MSIMEKIFGAKTVNIPVPQPGQENQIQQTNQPLPTNNLQNPPNVTTQQTAQTSPNGVVPEQLPASPMEKFKDVWQPTPTDNSKPTPESNGFSPEQMMEAAGKVDFAKVVSREDLAKISQGGEEAVAAFANALNKTAQQVFGQSAVVSQKLIDQAVAKSREDFMSQLPQLVKRQNLNERLLGDNPAFANPAVAPVIAAIQAQLSEKYPKATAAELQEMSKEYLSGISTLISPPAKNSSAVKKGKDDIDWENYLA